MVSFAYAAPRMNLAEARPVRICTSQGPAPGRIQKERAERFDFTRRLAMGVLALAMLALIGWGAARLMDSLLLGFVFADLIFLVGVALRGAVTPPRRSRLY